ncbi:hypothetical protein NAC44_18220 [Allorhizobium sp. BGMRC 0089]|nr:hypothetical protein [Allorhizobium sonneratiae]
MQVQWELDGTNAAESLGINDLGQFGATVQTWVTANVNTIDPSGGTVEIAYKDKNWIVTYSIQPSIPTSDTIFSIDNVAPATASAATETSTT